MRVEELVKRYKKAYKNVNKKDISVDYYHGWYYLGADKYRAKKIHEMCEVLETRYKEVNEVRSMVPLPVEVNTKPVEVA